MIHEWSFGIVGSLDYLTPNGEQKNTILTMPILQRPRDKNTQFCVALLRRALALLHATSGHG
jgi:hypothetical protein